MPHDRPRVVLLSGPDFGSRVVARALDERFDLRRVLVERKASRRRMVTRRARRLGWPTVLNQLAFQSAGAPLVALASRRRREALIVEHGWQDAAGPADRTTRLDTINCRETVETLWLHQPDVVVVSGTRIVGRKVLGCVEAPFVNIHAGITPRYRGVHGGYWALAEQRPDLCGVTIHLVDSGVDTGGVLAQARIRPTADDTYATYPLLQLAAGVPLLLDAVERLASGDRTTIDAPPEESALWYHPTATGYVHTWWRYGVR